MAVVLSSSTIFASTKRLISGVILLGLPEQGTHATVQYCSKGLTNFHMPTSHVDAFSSNEQVMHEGFMPLDS